MTDKDEEQQRLTTNGSSSSTSAANAPAELEAYGAVTSPAARRAPATAVAAATNGNGLAVNGLGDVYGERDGGEAGRRKTARLLGSSGWYPLIYRCVRVSTDRRMHICF